MLRPTLILFAGLPGTGKATVAQALAGKFKATYLRIDVIEQTVQRSAHPLHPLYWATARRDKEQFDLALCVGLVLDPFWDDEHLSLGDMDCAITKIDPQGSFDGADGAWPTHVPGAGQTKRKAPWLTIEGLKASFEGQPPSGPKDHNLIHDERHRIS